MLIDPLAPLRALLFCALSLAVGLSAGYLYGRQSSAAAHLPAITALQSSVDSCSLAAAAAKTAADAERAESVVREARIAKALEDNSAIFAAAAKSRSRILTQPIRGNTECEQVINAVNDHFRGSKP